MSESETRQALLAALLAATGSPPPAESDPEVVIEAAEHSALRRDVLLEQLRALEREDPLSPPVAPSAPSPDERALQAQILALDEAWAEALRWARKGLAQRRQSIDRLRRVRSLDAP